MCMHMRVSVFVCIYASMHACLCKCVRVFLLSCTRVCMHVCVCYVCVYYTSLCMQAHLAPYVVHECRADGCVWLHVRVSFDGKMIWFTPSHTLAPSTRAHTRTVEGKLILQRVYVAQHRTRTYDEPIPQLSDVHLSHTVRFLPQLRNVHCNGTFTCTSTHTCSHRHSDGAARTQ
jgi:hypothetical protein